MSLLRTALTLILLTCSGLGHAGAPTPFFSSLPVGEWTDIPDSALVLSPLFGPYPPEGCVNGIEGRASIYDSWGSGALDTNADRLLIRGGGHGAYAGNEMYAFDFRSLQWQRPFDGSPSDTIPCPPPDDKDYETYPPSSEVDVAGAGLGSDPTRVWFVGDTQADGTLHPSARHAYGGFFFDPDLNTANQIGGAHYAQGGRSNSVWSYDLTVRRWHRLPDIPEGDYGDVGVFDPQSHRIYHVGKTTFNVFDDVLNTWTTLNGNPVAVDEWGSDDRKTGAVIPDRRWLIVLGREQVWVFHLDTGQMWVQPTSGPTPGYPASITHVPGTDTVHIWSGATPRTIFELDLATWRFYPITPSTGATPFVSGNFRTLNRFGYDPEQGVFYVTDSADAPISVFKPSFAPVLDANVERLDCTSIEGWAWDVRKGAARISVDVSSDGALIGSVTANMFSQDLLDAGKGDGSHAFRFDVPRSIQDGKSHTIEVKYAGTGTSIPAAVSTLTCGAPLPPSAPTGLVASIRSGSEIGLTWTDTSSNETGFRLERRAAGESTYSTLALLGQNAHSFEDEDLPALTQFFYRVFAIDNAGDSLPSNEANATTGASHAFINGGFESPNVNGSYLYNPEGATWTFIAGAGISANDTAFTNGNTPAPEGQQVAFLQQSGSMTQTADVPAGQYAVTLMAAQRRNYAIGNQAIAIKVDAATVAQFQPSLDYTRFTTPPFTLSTNGNHAITLSGLANGDFTAFVDDVRIVAFSASSLASSANPAMSGAPVTFTALVTGNAPTGSVTLTDAGVSLPGCTDVAVEGAGNSRSASCTITATGVGTHDIVAHYSGDSSNAPAISTALAEVVSATTALFADGGFETPDLAGGFAYGPAGSAWMFFAGAGMSADNTGFTAGNAAAPEGRQVALLQGIGSLSQTANFTAGRYVLTLSAAQRMNYQTGTQIIAVQLDGVTIAQFQPPAGPYARFATPAFSITTAGNHTVGLVGVGNGNDYTALLDDVRIVAETTTTLASSLNPAVAGSPVSLTSTVTGANPAGSVAFVDGAVPVAGCASVPLTGSGNTRTALCSTADFSVGTHDIVASYNGDGANAASSSAVVSQVIGANPTNVAPTVMLTAPVMEASYVAPASIAFSANAGDSDGTISKVEFLQGTTVIGTVTSAPYSFNWTNVPAGSYTVAARATDNGHAVTTSASVTLTVSPGAPGLRNGGFETPDLGGGFQYGPAGATWVLAGGGGISANDTGFTGGNAGAPEGGQVAFLQFGGSIAQTATIAAGQYTLSLKAAQRQNSQSGAQVIAVQVDGVTVGQYQPPGVAYGSFTTAPFTIAGAGNHTITLVGKGSGSDYTAFIDDVRLANWNGPANTSTVLSSSNNPSFVGTAVTFTAVVSGTSATGMVAFTDAGIALSGCASVALTGSGDTASASCSTSSLSMGTHSIAAAYSGDSMNLGSGSNALSQAVSATAPSFANGGFEVPDLDGGYQYGPAGAAWVFVNGGGISANETGFTSGNGAAPEGSQVAFLQFGGSIAQTASMAAGQYTLSLTAAQRENSQSGAQVIAIQVDGVTVAQYQPPGVSYSSFTSPPFTLSSSGNHTIALIGVGTGSDYTAFIDDVRLTAR